MGDGRKRSGPARLARVGLAGLALLVGACSSKGEAGPAAGSDTTVAAPGTSAAPSTTAGPDLAQLNRLWVDYWATLAAPDQAAATAKVQGFASTDLLQSLQDLKSQAYQSGATPGELVHNAVPATTAANGASVKDCIILSGSRFGNGVAFNGEANWADGRWTLTSVRATGGGLGQSLCVPKAANDALLAAYRNWFVQDDLMLRNPDPANPLVDQLIVEGNFKQIYVKLLTTLRDKGEYAVVFPPDTQLNAEVYAWSGTRASVQDCRDANPLYGQFKKDGTRVIPQEPPGTTSAYEVDLVLQGSTWKVSTVRSDGNAPCVKAPSSGGLAVVG